jgi:hypothetical protein
MRSETKRKEKNMEMTRERKILINKIDVEYRDIANFDNQFEVMSYILNCLSDEQLNTAKKLIKVWKQQEKKTA